MCSVKSFHSPTSLSLCLSLHVCPSPLSWGVYFISLKPGIQAPSAIRLPDICLLSLSINSCVSQALQCASINVPLKTSIPTLNPKAKPQTVISVIVSAYSHFLWKEGAGRDCIFMMLWIIHTAIWDAQVCPTDSSWCLPKHVVVRAAITEKGKG